MIESLLLGLPVVAVAAVVVWYMNRKRRPRRSLKELANIGPVPMWSGSDSEFDDLQLPDRPMKNRSMARRVRDDRRHPPPAFEPYLRLNEEGETPDETADTGQLKLAARPAKHRAMTKILRRDRRGPAPQHPVQSAFERFQQMLALGDEDAAYVAAAALLVRLPQLVRDGAELAPKVRNAAGEMAEFVFRRLAGDRDVHNLRAVAQALRLNPALEFLAGQVIRAEEDSALFERIIGIIRESPGLSGRELATRLNLNATRTVGALEFLSRNDWLRREKLGEAPTWFLAARLVEEQDQPPVPRRTRHDALMHPSPFPDQPPQPT